MYDVNPLGPLMHLQELERRAATVMRGSRTRRVKRAAPAWLWLPLVMMRLRLSIRRKMPAG